MILLAHSTSLLVRCSKREREEVRHVQLKADVAGSAQVDLQGRHQLSELKHLSIIFYIVSFQNPLPVTQPGRAQASLTCEQGPASPVCTHWWVLLDWAAEGLLSNGWQLSEDPLLPAG